MEGELILCMASSLLGNKNFIIFLLLIIISTNMEAAMASQLISDMRSSGTSENMDIIIVRDMHSQH